MSHEIAVTHKFTEQQRHFVQMIVLGADKTDAATRAGYSSDNAERIANEMLRTPHILAAVQIGVAKQLALAAPLALKLLRDIAADETCDKRLRVVCAKTLLDRAGHIAPKAIAAAPGGETPLNEMSMLELRALADKLSGEIAGRAKEVKSARAAPIKTQAFDDLI